MDNILEALRIIIGPPPTSAELGLMLEYFAALLLLCICVSSVFKLLKNLTK